LSKCGGNLAKAALEEKKLHGDQSRSYWGEKRDEVRGWRREKVQNHKRHSGETNTYSSLEKRNGGDDEKEREALPATLNRQLGGNGTTAY